MNALNCFKRAQELDPTWDAPLNLGTIHKLRSHFYGRGGVHKKHPANLTKLCISVSKKPGTSGSKFHNAGYKLLNLNYLYVPFKFDNLDNLKIVLNKFNIRGCSVSMPFKEKIIKF